MNSQEHIVIFSGAGASKAVNSDRFPTTIEFFQLLPDHIHNNLIFRFVLEYLHSVRAIERVDIEQVLWELSALSAFFKSVSEPNDIVGYAMRFDLISKLYIGQSVGHVIHASGTISGQIDDLVDQINEIVYDLYSYEPEEHELAGNWSILLSMLDPLVYKLDLFSTNYDAVIETCLGNTVTDSQLRSLQGLRGRKRTELNLGRWTTEGSNESLLTKLHGSIDWKVLGDHIYVGDAVFTGDHAKQAIVYPGFKGTSDSAFFAAFHTYLSRAISNGTHFIFIGFAFRDEYINSLIRNNIDPGAKIVVINPDKNVVFPYVRSKVQYINEYFNESSVLEAYHALRLSKLDRLKK